MTTASIACEPTTVLSSPVVPSPLDKPLDKVPFQFGLTVTAWQLPFGMMIIDCLSQQNAAAAWPHILGIFSGHFFHFFSKILSMAEIKLVSAR